MLLMGADLERRVGRFILFFSRKASHGPMGSRKTGREALGQVDSEPQGWELCWRDPRYLSMPLCQLELQIPPL